MSLNAFFNQHKVICPKCEAAGEKSTVRYRGGSTTLMACSPFYDEDGEYHSHDTNTVTTGYECSGGHWWSVKTRGSCPNPKCDWKQDVESL